jgi:hypothetical protein
MGIRQKLIHILLLGVLITGVSSPARAQRSPLTQNQLGHLIKIQAPDRLIATQIQTRGLSFPVTHAIVNSFSQEGAGPDTLMALRELIRVGAIVIQTEPESSIMMDDQYEGATNSQGRAMIQDVPVGPHQVVISKQGFQSGQQNLVVANGQVNQISIALQWMGGYLSVQVHPANASVSVTGPLDFNGARSHVPCQPGTYAVAASAPGYLIQTKKVQIETGSDETVEINLQPDPAYLMKMLSGGADALTAGNLHQAAQDARAVLALSPDNLLAEGLLAKAAFQAGDQPLFEQEAMRVLQGGGTLKVTMMHLRNFPTVRLEPMQLTFSAQGVAFSGGTSTRKEKIPASLSYPEVVTAQFRRLPTGTQELWLQWISSHHNRFMAIEHDLEFVVNGSEVIMPTGTLFNLGANEPVRSPNIAWQQINCLAYLFRQFHR